MSHKPFEPERMGGWEADSKIEKGTRGNEAAEVEGVVPGLPI